MTAAYRENDNISARITELDDRLHDIEGQLAKRSPKMDDNTKEARITTMIIAGLSTMLLGVTLAVVYTSIDGHRSEERIAHEKTIQTEHEANTARETAAKAMWDHVVSK